MRNATFPGARLSDATLTGTTLSGADLTGADLTGDIHTDPNLLPEALTGVNPARAFRPR
jgi:uncharacterized protein YjbI with pentapeptide repeats